MADYASMDRPTLERLLVQPIIGAAAKERIRAHLHLLDRPAGNRESPGKEESPEEVQARRRRVSRKDPPRLEKAVEAEIDAELERLGFDVTRFSQPRASMQTPGIPDRYVRHFARRVRLWIELKAPGGSISKDQKGWHKRERAAGGEVAVVWSVRDLHEELRHRGFEP